MILQRLSQYGLPFQIKVLSSILTDKGFLLQVKDTLKIDYFDADAHKWIIQQAVSYFEKYHTNVTLEVLAVEVKKLDNDILKTAITEQLREAYRVTNEDHKYIQEEFATFCKNQALKAALLQTPELINNGDYDSIRTIIEGALKAGTDKNIGHEYNIDIETRYRQDYRPVIPTPWEEINTLTQGGFGPGDLVIAFGSPGGGKCLDENTVIEIQYPEYGLELANGMGEVYTLWIQPWEEFNIDGRHLYGWQVYNLLVNFKK